MLLQANGNVRPEICEVCIAATKSAWQRFPMAATWVHMMTNAAGYTNVW